MIHKQVGCLSYKSWLIVICLLLLLVQTKSCWAQDSAVLKSDIPKLDTNVDQNPPAAAPSAKKTPLQGKVQKDDQLNKSSNMFGGVGKFFGRGEQGKLGRGSGLRGNTKNNAISGAAEESVGIIGVKFVLFNGRAPVVNRVFPTTPAYKCGVQPFDVIVAVDGVPTFGLTKEEVYDMIVGTPGTPVTISIRREGDYKVYNMVRMDLNDITDPFIRRDYMMSM